MPFVKLDCKMLDSTTWIDREAREVFITALLMARPYELTEATPQIRIRSLHKTGWQVPSGWYGFVPAAGIGIVRRAGINLKSGLLALERLGAPEPESRSREYDGRRLVRINGGFIVLNYMKHWDRDETGAERQRRYRMRQAARGGNAVTSVTSRNEVTNKNKEVEVDKDKETTTTTKPRADARWIHPLATMWCERYQVKRAPFGLLGKYLKPLKDDPDLPRRFAAYVAATDAKYVSLPKFVDTYGSWGNGKKVPQTYNYTPGVKGPEL